MTRRPGRAGRVVGGVAAVAALAAVTVAGSLAPVPEGGPPAVSQVRVAPTATTLVCPGPVALPADGGVGDDAFDPRPVDAQTALRVATAARPAADGTAPLVLAPLAGGAPLLEAPGGGPAQAGSLSVTGPTLLRADPVGDLAAVAAGSSASVVTQGDLLGLSAGTCAAPSADLWLVGGSTELGSSALLVVANPGRTPAEVTVELYGPGGPVEGTGARLLVAPGAERAVLLEGIAAEQRRVVAHVTAAGGLVTAYLQDSRLRGFTPAGVDLVTAGAAPATRQVVGGLVVPETTTGDPDTALVRLLAPGATGTRADLTLLGPDGPVTLPGAERVELGPGEVTDVSLAGVPAGAYTVLVEADEPVVAGAMLTRPGPPLELDDVPTLDRAWSASAAVDGEAVVALPRGLAASVLVGSVAPPGAPADGDGASGVGLLRAFGRDGTVLAEEAVSVPAGTTLRVRVGGEGFGGGGGEVAAVQLVPGAAEEGAPTLGMWALLSTGTPDLVSVLTPVPEPGAQPTVAVREWS